MDGATTPFQDPAVAGPAAFPAEIGPSVRPRVWPGAVLVVAQALAILVPGWVAPQTMTQFMGMFFGPMVGGAALLVWWLFASRVRLLDRLLVLLVFAAAAGAAVVLTHPSLKMGLIMYALPVATSAWVAWLVLTPFLAWPVRRLGLLAVVVLAWTWPTLVRMDGVDGAFAATLNWRWSPTSEEQFLSERAAAGAAPTLAPAGGEALKAGPGDWVAFRGPARDGRLFNVRVATDWTANPPRQVWRQRVGPGWSSFSVVGKNLFTQEQRGESEAVVCYEADTGKERWAHDNKARFTEPVAGPGPRATPTFDDGRLYAFGASGLLSCLDAATGREVWTRDAAADAGVAQEKRPMWGYSSSPLVARGRVVVHVSNLDDNNPGPNVLGYKADTGELAWKFPEGKHSYSSPQMATLGGVEQALLNTDAGLVSFDPATGAILWRAPWPLVKEGIVRVVQPAVVSDSEVLLGTGFHYGTRLVSVTHSGGGWQAKDEWTTTAIKPYFNDFVVHKGHLYGFDGGFLVCVSLADGGKGVWRARGYPGPYGNGQLLLLADQDLLLVLSEKGVASLVEAGPQAHKELGHFQAIKGKTWNHPVVAHGKLYVRNADEMACYALAEAPAR